VCELVRCASPRARFVALTCGALAAASLILAFVSGPYLHRSTSSVANASGPALDVFWGTAGWIILAADLRDPIWVGTAALAIVGAAAGLRGRASHRALAASGLAFVVIGVALLAFGWPWPLGGWLAFFRARTRYLLLSSFGFSLLAAQGLDVLRTRLPSRLGGALLLVAVTGSLVLARRAAVVPRSDPVLAVSRDLELYRDLGRLVGAQGGGPLLEVPFVSNPLAHSAPEEMVGQLEHGLPLITGFTGYRPDHHALLVSLVTTLPAAPALDDLVDLTHLRWILIRPTDEWPDPAVRQRFLNGLRRYPALGPSWTIGPWILQRLDRAPAHQAWFDWLAAGPQPGRSVLGTPRGSIPEADAIAAVSARAGSSTVRSAWVTSVALEASNRGAAAWPTWGPTGSSEPGLVRWEARWRRADRPDGEWGPVTTVALRRDVPAGEALSQTIVLATPEEPGAYDLRVGVRQKNGATFSAPGNEVATLRLDVLGPR
jgi:hypothetical protein